jgi:hypothetical protein
MLKCQGNNQSEMIWIIRRNNVARSPYRCCHGNTVMRSLSVIVDGHVGVNNMKLLGVAVETKPLSSYRIFRTAVSNISVLRSSRKVPDFLFYLKEIWVFRQIFVGVPNKSSRNSCNCEPRLSMPADRHNEASRPSPLRMRALQTNQSRTNLMFCVFPTFVWRDKISKDYLSDIVIFGHIPIWQSDHLGRIA